MTHEPPEEPPPSIYTRLDGSPLPRPVAPPTAPPPPSSSGWPSPAQAPQQARPLAGQQTYVLATWGSRAGAFVIDAFLFGILAWLIMLPVGRALGLSFDEAARYFARLSPLPTRIDDPTPFYLAVAVQVMLPGIALALSLLVMDGQSPGKRVAGIRVVRADGRAMNSQTAFRRELLVKTILLGLLGALTFLIAYPVNYLWPLRDREHRAGHDFAVDTRVVQAPKRR